MVRTNRFLVDTIVTCEGERTESDPPWGIFGGHDGTNASTKITKPDGTVESWPSKFTGHTLAAGSTIEIVVPNSGGYGDPFERDPELVVSDVLDDYTTAELAERDYGVVVDIERRAVDHEATRRRRAPRGPGPGTAAT
jgi:5-oxoprolinase (ATP-hydrolysing)